MAETFDDQKMALLEQQFEEKQKEIEMKFAKSQKDYEEKGEFDKELPQVELSEERLAELEEKKKQMDLEHETHLKEIDSKTADKEQELELETKNKISEIEKKKSEEEERIKRKAKDRMSEISAQAKEKKAKIEARAKLVKNRVDKLCEDHMRSNHDDIKDMEEEGKERVKSITQQGATLN